MIARIGIDEFGGGAFAHESTMSGPKADRLRLLQACEANFSQIFALYSDPDGSVEAPLVAATAAPPLVSFDDGKGVVHNLWRVEDPALIARAREGFAGKPFIIADGHHRYETALEYRRLMRQDPARFRESMDSVMMCLVRMESPGLTILPFHRMLVAPGPERILERIGAAFDLEERQLPADRSSWTGATQELLGGDGHGLRPLPRRPDADAAAPEGRGGSFAAPAAGDLEAGRRSRRDGAAPGDLRGTARS